MTREATTEEARSIARRALYEALAELGNDAPDLAHVYMHVESALIWLRPRSLEEAHPSTMIGRP